MSFENYLLGEASYSNLLERILDRGEKRSDRTGVGTLSLFGESLRWDLRGNFPMLHNKRVHWKSVIGELLWFLEGANCTEYLCVHKNNCANVKSLQARGVTIWDEWADDNGCLGPVYGVQWDKNSQLEKLVSDIKYNPSSRRHILSAWSPEDLNEMALPPCHMMAQFYVSQDGHLDCQMYQRSADMFLGVPFNIASYAALTYMIALLIGREPGNLTLVFGDCHIYSNHIKAVEKYLNRVEKSQGGIGASGEFSFPTLSIEDVGQGHLKDFKIEDFTLHNYNPLPTIKAPIAV